MPASSSSDPDAEETRAEALQVAVRVRPTMPSEAQADRAASVDGSTISVKGGKHNSSCKYDTVFPETSTQDDVFDFVKPSILQVAQGYNCTIFGTSVSALLAARELAS